jgi:phenylpropionate dioxygenase-like ring-hydroxylating dioxygenase large terminal subunit
MPRQEALDLTRRVLKHFENDTLDIADEVWREPRAVYVDPGYFEADLAMLRKAPHVIGWAGEVATPGQYTTKDVMGVPVLVTRARDGVLRAFINGCAHRGAQVAADCGKTRMFSCPYHGWTYGLDGRLAGAPARRMFDGALEGRGLVPLPISDEAGLLVVGLSDDVDVSAALGDVAQPLSEYGFDHSHHAETRRFDLACNWKLAIDVNFEGYHFPYVHADTLDPLASNNSVYDIYGRNIRWSFPFRDIVQYRDVPEVDWPDQFFGTVVYGLFPSCVLIEAPGTSQMLRAYPGKSPGETVLYLSIGAPKEIATDEERAWYKMGIDGAAQVLDGQDFPMAAACQRGLEAGVDHVVFGRNEPLLHHLAAVRRESLARVGKAAI